MKNKKYQKKIDDIIKEKSKKLDMFCDHLIKNIGLLKKYNSEHENYILGAFLLLDDIKKDINSAEWLINTAGAFATTKELLKE